MNVMNILRRSSLNILKSSNFTVNIFNATKIGVNKSIIYKTQVRFTNNVRPHFLKSLIISTSFLTWLGFKEDDENEESQLIMTLKRSILCIQRKEFVKAEQMLHLALRLAQEQQNEQGITYAYDLMANLAMERNQLDKSEKLFVNVLQRLLSTGTSENDLKVIHISLKLARIYQMRNEDEKAEIGYKWCLEVLDNLKNSSKDTIMLKGAILDWYGNFLALKGDFKNSLRHLEEAYKIHSEFEGTSNEKSALLLNDLATVNCNLGDFEMASKNLEEALKIGKKLDDFSELGSIYANFGLVKFKLGLLNEAKMLCKEGWRLGKKIDNADTMNQANYCFEQLNKNQK